MISVVIPCLNEVEFIDATLNSLVTQDSPGEEWEVIVADGGSTDGTREKLEEWSERHKEVRWIDNPKRTTPHALNAGIEAAKGDVIIILGAHAEVSPDWLLRNHQVLLAHPESGCVGGVVEQVHGSQTSQRIGAAMSTPFGVGDARFRTGGSAGHVDTVAFGAYRREALKEIGCFDTALTRNQDDELNYRLLKAGWRIWFDPRIRSVYHARSGYGKLFRQYRQYGYWKVFVNRKHRTVTTWRQLAPAAFLLVLVALSVGALVDLGLPQADRWTNLAAPALATVLGTWMLGAIGSVLLSGVRWRDALGVMRSFLILHVAYGLGYWQGVLDFLILRRSPSAESKQLTR